MFTYSNCLNSQFQYIKSTKLAPFLIVRQQIHISLHSIICQEITTHRTGLQSVARHSGTWITVGILFLYKFVPIKLSPTVGYQRYISCSVEHVRYYVQNTYTSLCSRGFVLRIGLFRG
jgi:hypothetical protein